MLVNRLGFDVHHLDYRRVGSELFSDLLVVCIECHEKIEAFIDLHAERFGRQRVMDRLKPYAIRRLLKLHSTLCKRHEQPISARFEDAIRSADPRRDLPPRE